MATKKRGGLGRGIGALIPQVANTGARPVDVFFASDSAAGNNPAAQEVEGAQAGGAQAGGAQAGGAQAGGAQAGSAQAAAKTAATSAASSAINDARLKTVPGAELRSIALNNIVPNRVQPRRDFDEDALAELTHSVKEFGVLQPIVVRGIIPAPAADQAQYELIMGERRWRAAQRAGLSEIPAVVRGTADENMLRDALLENLHRAELNPLEEASAYQQLLADFGITQEQLAAKIGRSRPQISNTIRLLKLPENVQLRVAAGVLSAGHARAILALDGNVQAMQSLADKVVNQGLSVRQTEEIAQHPQRAPRAKVRVGGVQTQLNEIAERLGDRFDTRVLVKLGQKKGQVIIDFATVADLQRILAELGDPGFNNS